MCQRISKTVVFHFVKISLLFFIVSCSNSKNKEQKFKFIRPHVSEHPVTVDCNYTFDEAIAGTHAPASILKQLRLLEVKYYSFDNRIHKGQILTNVKIAPDVVQLFAFMFTKHFPIGSVVPIVKYNWNDSLSMQANNSYSFCYRDITFSKHAYGLALDINPFQNPVRWKNAYHYRMDQPIGAVYNPNHAGTFSISSYIVHEFKVHGFRWGHGFKRNFDDHHFEK
jgi:peptidoglycan L-alanyl-D-glutamate endopeptidase CwlK